MGKGRLEKMIARAEEAVIKKAAEYAYQCTNNITEGAAQTTAYTMIKDSIILGARFMQEELKKDNEKEP